MVEFRTEHVRFAFAEETTEGQAPDTIATNMGLIKGGVVLPDVEYAYDYFWGVGRGGRSRLDAHEGLQTFHGSIPVILMQFNESRAILEMVLGVHSADVAEASAAAADTSYTATTMVNTGEDFTGSPDAKDGTHAVFAGNSVGYISTTVGGGITEVTVYPTPLRTGTAGWNGPIPVSGANGDGYEIRVTTSVGTSSGDKFTVQQQFLKSMAWAVEIRGSKGQSSMVVNYLGGKVNRATLSARQGQKLQLALDDVIFRDLLHDVALPSTSVPKYGAIGSGATGTKRPTATHPTEDPLVFSQGTISMFELSNTFARINSFSLAIDNQLTEQNYLATISVAGATVISQIPFELTEGLRTITLEVEALLDNRQYWEHLMRQGQNDALSARTGFDMMLEFRVDAASAEKLQIQSPAAGDPVFVAGVDGSTALASASNRGIMLESAPHSIPAETESLIPVRLRFNLPTMVVRYDDS